MVLTLIVWGAFVWRERRWPWMLAGAAFMFASAAIPTSVLGFLFSNLGEVALAAALVATEARALRGEMREPQASRLRAN